MSARVSDWHVIWAYDAHIWRWHFKEGLTVNAIRTKLREEHCLAVGAEAIRAVIESRKGSA